MIAAVDRDDPGRGTPFVASAVAYVVGEGAQPLSTRHQLAAAGAPPAQGTSPAAGPGGGRAAPAAGPLPTLELAEQLELGKEQVLEALAAGSRQELSLDQPAGADPDLRLGDLVSAPEAGEEPEDLLALPGLVARLLELEREVIVLRFFQELDQYQIAARVGYSQMHVSRLQRRALAACWRSWWSPDQAEDLWDAGDLDAAGHPRAGAQRDPGARADSPHCRLDQASVIPPPRHQRPRPLGYVALEAAAAS